MSSLSANQESVVVEGPAASNGAPSEEGRTLSVLQHLEELRKRILICLAAVTLGTVVSLAWAGRVIEWLKRPAGEALPRLAFFSPAEGVLAYLKVAATAGFILAMPVILHQVWVFVRPGLSNRERRFGLLFIGWGSLSFSGGLAFAYWVLLPASLRFLLSFGSDSLVPMISVSQYLGFVTTVLLAAGFTFEMPLAIFLLARLGMVSPRFLRRQWRLAVVGMMVGAALLTPTTDAVTMLLLAAPMLLLYEVSIRLATLAGCEKKGRE